MSELKTPDEWCTELGYEVLDPDGWRGSGGRSWTDPISRAEFEQRLVVCTQIDRTWAASLRSTARKGGESGDARLGVVTGKTLAGGKGTPCPYCGLSDGHTGQCPVVS